MQFNFALKFQLRRRWSCAEEPGVTRALAGAGVQLVRHRSDRLKLDFACNGPDARSSMRQAIKDVRRLMPMAELAEAMPDYIGLSGLAALFGVSRQAMRKQVVCRAGRFPAPVHEVHTAIWHLAPVLEWVQAMGMYRIDKAMLETARAAEAINLALDAQRMRKVRRDTLRLIELPREIAALLREAGYPALEGPV